jgi:hypothetical protein
MMSDKSIRFIPIRDSPYTFMWKERWEKRDAYYGIEPLSDDGLFKS